MIFAWGERKRKERVRYCHLRQDTKRVCARVKKEEDAKKEKEERAAKREPLREKEDSQERVVRGEENKKERAKCCRL